MENFFPPRAFSSSPPRHRFYVRWYTKHLVSMRQRPLFRHTLDRPETYRYLYLPTWTQPILVTLVKGDGGWSMTCTTANGRGGFEPGKTIAHFQRLLSAAEVTQLQSHLQIVDFWNMQSWFVDNTGDKCDGDEHILEGVRDGRYHVVDRGDPEGTDFGGLAEFLLTLARHNSVPELVALLTNANENMRGIALGLLQGVNDPRVVPGLLQLVASDPDPDIRTISIWTLSKIGGGDCLATLESASQTDAGVDSYGRKVSDMAQEAISAILTRLKKQEA
jgi:hypothetical protein